VGRWRLESGMISWGEVPRRPPWRVRLLLLVYRVQDWWEVRQGRRIPGRRP